MSCSIPVTQETMFSVAPFLVLLALNLGCLPSSTRLFPFQHPLLHALPLAFVVPKSCQEHWEMNKSDQSTLGWKAGFCPWHWDFHGIWLDMPLGCHSVNISFGSSTRWSGLHHPPPSTQSCHHCSFRPLGPFLSHAGIIVWPGRKMLQRRDQSSA